MNAPEHTSTFAAEAVPYVAEGPQPLVRDIPRGNPYPVEALGPLRAAVEAVQDMTQAPAAIAAQSTLAVASLVLQPHANVALLAGSTSPLSLFLLTIADSGERKSSADRLVMLGVRAFEAALDKAYREESVAQAVARDIWSTTRKRLLTEASGSKKDKAAAANADLRALGPEPSAPLVPMITSQDPTLEGLLKLYQIGRPSIGLFNDEGGGFIGGHAMNSDNRLKTMAGLSQLWNADPVNRVRSGDGVSSYPGRRLAMHLMAQAIAARPLLSDPQASGQGFLARFLITEPPSAIGTRLRRGHAPASDAVLKDFSERVMSLLNAPLPTGDHPQELMPRRLLLSPAAEELLWRFHETIEKEQGPGGALEHIRSFASKAAEQAARLAGILTLWTDFEAGDVKAEAMGCGITLAQFYLTEAKRLVEAGLVSAKTAQAETLRKWLLESWQKDRVTPSDILKFGPNALRERPKLTEPLAMLVKAGWLVRLNDAVIAGKPRKEAYKIVRGPNVL